MLPSVDVLPSSFGEPTNNELSVFALCSNYNQYEPAYTYNQVFAHNDFLEWWGNNDNKKTCSEIYDGFWNRYNWSIKQEAPFCSRCPSHRCCIGGNKHITNCI